MPSTMSDRLGSINFEPNSESRSKLKRIVIGVMILFAALFLLPSTFTYINPGHVGIVIHRDKNFFQCKRTVFERNKASAFARNKKSHRS